MYGPVTARGMKRCGIRFARHTAFCIVDCAHIQICVYGIQIHVIKSGQIVKPDDLEVPEGVSEGWKIGEEGGYSLFSHCGRLYSYGRPTAMLVSIEVLNTEIPSRYSSVSSVKLKQNTLSEFHDGQKSNVLASCIQKGYSKKDAHYQAGAV